MPAPNACATLGTTDSGAVRPPAASAVAATGTLPPAALPGSAGPAGQVPGQAVLGKFGEGGRGVVYKARHVQLNRIVALKMILTGGHACVAELARFQTEAEAWQARVLWPTPRTDARRMVRAPRHVPRVTDDG